MHPVKNWESAADYLSRGRHKHRRPLYTGSLHVWKLKDEDPNSDIAIGWYKWNRDAPIVIYHKDGTATLPGLAVFPSARRYACQFANVMGLYYRNGKLKVQQVDDPIAKRRKRRCKNCLGYKQIIFTCTGERRYSRFTWHECDDEMHKYGETHTVTQKCNNCIDGFLSPREAYESFVWKQRGSYTHHHWSRPKFPALRIDLDTGKIIAIEIVPKEKEQEDVRSA